MDTTDEDIIQPRTLSVLFVELRRENLEIQEKQKEIMNLSFSLKNTSAPGRVTKEIQNAAQTLQNLQSLSTEKLATYYHQIVQSIQLTVLLRVIDLKGKILHKHAVRISP